MSCTQWWDANKLRYLPLHTIISCYVIVLVSSLGLTVDGFYEFYRPFEFSIVSDLFPVTTSHSVW